MEAISAQLPLSQLGLTSVSTHTQKQTQKLKSNPKNDNFTLCREKEYWVLEHRFSIVFGWNKMRFCGLLLLFRLRSTVAGRH